MPSLERIQDIRARIAPHVHRTPLLPARSLGAALGVELHFKAELFQRTGSYKPRGILNRLMSLSAEERARGVITVSAGNAAQGLAYAARCLGCKAVAVMPENASPAKVAATRGYGAEAILRGNAKAAFALAEQLCRDHRYVFVAPSDHPDVIEGHASIGVEILEDLPDVELIMVPVGAGGLAAGVATGVAAMGSSARVVGVEPVGANTLWRSLQAGKPVDLPGPPDTVADGLAYPFGGKHTFPVFRDLGAGVVLVQDAEIVEAMRQLFTRAKLYAEPSGAAGLAGLMVHGRTLAPRGKVVCVVSGGNLDPERLPALLVMPAPTRV